MKTTRAIFSGALMWLLIFSAFIIISFIPAVKDSLTLQGFVVGFLVIPFASFGTRFYFKKGNKSAVLPVVLIMVGTAMILDAIITVPFIEIPYNGRGYVEFFTDPLFWILIVEIATVIYFYWKIKIRPLAG